MNTEALQEIPALIYQNALDTLSSEDLLKLLMDILEVKNQLDLMSQLGFNVESSFLTFIKNTHPVSNLIEFINTSPAALSGDLLKAIGVTFSDADDLPDNGNLWKAGCVFNGKQYVMYSQEPEQGARQLAIDVIKSI